MRGLDTNVLVRFVTQDDREQSARANAVLGGALVAGERLFVNAIVLCELVWVLRSAYGHSREEILPVLDALLETPELIIEDAAEARRAVAEWAALGGDFADRLIGHRNARLGCASTLTFDDRAAKSPLFALV